MKIASMRQLVSRMQNLHLHHRQLEQQFASFLDGAKTVGSSRFGIDGVSVGEVTNGGIDVSFGGRVLRFTWDAVTDGTDKLRGRILCREMRGGWFRTVAIISFDSNGDTDLQLPDSEDCLPIDTEQGARALVWHYLAAALDYDFAKGIESDWSEVT